MPVSGVRTSCAKAASALSTMPETAMADVRVARFFAAALDTRFFARRFFTVLVVPGERRFAAMIPLPLPLPA